MTQTNRKRPTRSNSPRRGFTLLELLLVLAILVVLGGIVITQFANVGEGARADATRIMLDGLKRNVQMYKIKTGSLPENLQSLIDGPNDAAQKATWAGALIEEIPQDAWGKDLVFSVNGNTFEITSGGLDGQTNTDDDIKITGK